jgi:hypothetical protein
MCWIVTTLGAMIFLVGAFLIIRFFMGHGINSPEVAGEARVESMVVGTLLAAVGFLLFMLGLMQTICPVF